MNKKNEGKQIILEGIYGQIASFDNKASILISVIGIVFALSLSFLDIFSTKNFAETTLCKRIVYYSLFIIFILNTFASIFSYIMVIIPRIKKGTNKYANYYKDASNYNIDDNGVAEYNNIFDSYNNDDNLITKQIIINSKICAKKHNWLRNGIISLIPFSILLFVLILLTIF